MNDKVQITWQDVRKIIQISSLMLNSFDYDQIRKMGEQGYYEEILKRFYEA